MTENTAKHYKIGKYDEGFIKGNIIKQWQYEQKIMIQD